MEQKRKRKDDEVEAQRAEVEKIGKNIGRVQRVDKKKDKGKLVEIVASIEKSKPTKDKYIVVTVDFYEAPIRHFIVTPFNKDKIIEQLRYLTRTKEVGTEFIGSGEVASLKPGMRIKSFFLSNRDSFKSKFSKVNIFKKKREGSFFPYQHVIKTNTWKRC